MTANKTYRDKSLAEGLINVEWYIGTTDPAGWFKYVSLSPEYLNNLHWLRLRM